MFKNLIFRYLAILLLVVIAGVIALPSSFTFPYNIFGRSGEIELKRPNLRLNIFGKTFEKELELKRGLDIQGGTQIVLEADMKNIPEVDRPTALESVREVIARRVDLFGVSEPVIQTSKNGDTYRLIVELAGLDDPNQAIQLIGATAQLDFRLEGAVTPEATASALAFLENFQPSGLTGGDLKRATLQFDQQTNEPVVSLEFNEEGTKKFAEITKTHVNQVLGIFLDGYPLMLPQIQTTILDGRAQISGQFSIEDAKNLAIQLNAGALPVPVQIVEQRTIGASLGQESINRSIVAGVIGLVLVMCFMMMVYGMYGLIANLGLIVYAILTIAVYKLFGVTVTLPGVAGLLLSVGMAVDANILIFERLKEELRAGKPFELAMKQGFGKAWDTIKDANFATIFVALILINPVNFSFLNTSGLVRGFGMTLLIGVLISLFTGVVVTRTLMRLFIKE